MIFDHIVREAENDNRAASTDYTEENVEDADEAGTDSDVGSTDYTEQADVEIEPDGPDEEDANTTPDDDTDSTGDEATDYTETGDEDGTGEDDSATDYGEDADPNADEENPDDPSPEDQRENENNRVLLDDTVNLYYVIKDTITNLTEVSKDNILVNKIINQVTYNLGKLEKAIYEFIVFQFSKNKYVNNLYKYNYFIKAFQTNIEMLKKIKVLVSN